ncbi:MAG: hypothetical protein OEQ53_02725, partial [Saprospiraceae bacterium]|nr:hypothetical protein [Saprospiraceae bacterium]
MRLLTFTAIFLLSFLDLVAAEEATATPSRAIYREMVQPLPDSLFKAMTWRNIGPFRGGRVTAVTGVVQDPFTFYFGSTGGGVWKTADGGGRWQNISDGYFKT